MGKITRRHDFEYVNHLSVFEAFGKYNILVAAETDGKKKDGSLVEMKTGKKLRERTKVMKTRIYEIFDP